VTENIGEPSELKPDFDKKDVLTNIYKAVHKEFLAQRAGIVRVGATYGTFSIAAIVWTRSVQNSLGLDELVVAFFALTVIAVYAHFLVRRLETQHRETGEVINKIQSLWKVFEPNYYASSFPFHSGNTLFPDSWKLTGKLMIEPAFQFAKWFVWMMYSLNVLFFLLIILKRR
jgi:hypothetical protein